MTKEVKFLFNLEYLKQNRDNLNETLQKCLTYLKNFNKQQDKLLIDKKGFNALMFVSKSLFDFQDEIDFTLFEHAAFEAVLSSLMMNFYEIRDEIKFNMVIKPHYAESSNDFDEKRIHLLSNLLFITNKLTFRCKLFGPRYVCKEGLTPYFLLLNDDKFLVKNKTAQINDLSCEPILLLDYLELNLYGLRSTCDEYKNMWLRLDAFNILLKLLKLRPALTNTVYRTIAFILDDEHLESAPVSESIAEFLFKYFAQCKSDFDADLFDARPVKFFLKDRVLIYGVHCLLDDFKKQLSMQALFECAYKLSINDKMKKLIYFRDGMKECFNSFLLKGKLSTLKVKINYCIHFIKSVTLNLNIFNCFSISYFCRFQNMKSINITCIKSKKTKLNLSINR